MRSTIAVNGELTMTETITIQDREIGAGKPVFIIAEISGNHNQSFETAVALVKAAVDAGVDAVKLQTYTADTLTVDCDTENFRIKGNTLWDGNTLYKLYQEAYTPWEWQPELKKIADDLGVILFSTPFDATAVEFLEDLDMPAYKVASFEIVDIPLLEKIAKTGKPVIMSTGMSTVGEIEEAVQTLQRAGNRECALLKCTSAYPASPDDMNLVTIPTLADVFHMPVGLSDHTLGTAASVAAVALGAAILEKHLTLSRSEPGPDAAFSLEPHEFRLLVEQVRFTEKALGKVNFGVTEQEAKSRVFRRSLFVVKDVRAGEMFNSGNVRSIRPGNGLHTRYLSRIMGCSATRDVKAGAPLEWNMIAESNKAQS